MGKKSARKKERKLSKNKERTPVKAQSNTFVELEKRFRDLEKRLEDVFSDNWGFPSRWELSEWTRLNKLKLTTPKVDIVDRDDDIMVRADVPGVKKENLDVSFTDNTVTIKGGTSEEKKEQKGDYFRNETMKGSFSRTVYLPSEVDGSKAESTFKDGVLEVIVPKLDKAKRIKVNVS
jgi:HSP20 family protein